MIILVFNRIEIMHIFKGGGCSEGLCDSCKFPEEACDKGAICESDETGTQVRFNFTDICLCHLEEMFGLTMK